MLRVKVELVPYGQEAGAQVIEEAFIANDGTEYGNTGSYDISEHNLALEYPLVERDRPEYLGRIEKLIRVPKAHRVTMARTALERIERRRYQEHGLTKTDESVDIPTTKALGTDGHGVGCEDYNTKE